MKITKYIYTVLFFAISASYAFAQQRALVWVEDGFSAQTLIQNGFTVNAIAGDVLSIQWEGDKKQQLSKIQGVKYVEQGGKVVPANRHDSLSLEVTQANLLHNNYKAYGFDTSITGRDVIVGIVDIGFQLDHPTFYDRSGQKNRIVRYWNQRDDSGNAPQGFSYGTLHTDVTQVNHIDKSEYHGTHVAGIAAGSGYTSPNYNQSGIAYDADIVLVDILYFNQSIPPGARSDYELANPAIIDAFDYIFKYADSVGKPAVINLSWGMHTGPHDGTSVFDRALDNLVGAGKVIVGSAGNSRGRNIHFYHEFNNDTVSAWVGEGINRAKTEKESNYIDLWGSPNTDFSVQLTLFDTLGNQRLTMPFISSTFDKDTFINLDVGDTVLWCYFQCKAKSPLNNKPNILLHITSTYPIKNYVVARFASTNTVLHGWNSGGVDRYTSGGFGSEFKGIKPFPNMKIGDNNYIVGENGGTANGVITVGSYTTAYVWWDVNGAPQPTYGATGYLASYSSQGPTVDGRTKPDISAPGVQISSAFNRHAIKRVDEFITYKTLVASDTQYFGVLGGTSMASPQVAGAVALMLQQDPTLTYAMVKDILHKTAVTDSFTNAAPNNLYGWGKLNALAAVQAVKGNVSVPDISTQNKVLVYPNPTNGTLNIDLYTNDNEINKCEIYNLQGQLVHSKDIRTGSTATLHIEHLKQGLYLLQISTRQGVFSRKINKD